MNRQYTVVGVVEIADWAEILAGNRPLHRSRFLPGDVLLRVGPPESPDALFSPFPGGLETVKNTLLKLHENNKWELIHLLVWRQEQEVEILAISKESSVKTGILFEGIALEEGSRAKFSQLSEKTRQQIAGIKNKVEREAEVKAISKLKSLEKQEKAYLADMKFTSKVPEPYIMEFPSQNPYIFPPVARKEAIYTILVFPIEIHRELETRSVDSAHSLLPKQMWQCHDVNHTVQRALKWLENVQNSGVNVNLTNLQTEPISGRFASSEEASRVLKGTGKYNASLIDDSHFYVVRGIRLWYVPGSETKITLEPSSEDSGLQISRTLEGICYVVDVIPDSRAEIAGIGALLEKAREEKRILTIVCINDEMMLPPSISKDGDVSCVDPASILAFLIASKFTITITFCM